MMCNGIVPKQYTVLYPSNTVYPITQAFFTVKSHSTSESVFHNLISPIRKNYEFTND